MRRDRPAAPRPSPRPRRGAPCGRLAGGADRGPSTISSAPSPSTRQPIEWPMCSRCHRPSASRWFASAGWKRAKVATTRWSPHQPSYAAKKSSTGGCSPAARRPAVAHRRADVCVAFRSLAREGGEHDVSRRSREVEEDGVFPGRAGERSRGMRCGSRRRRARAGRGARPTRPAGTSASSLTGGPKRSAVARARSMFIVSSTGSGSERKTCANVARRSSGRAIATSGRCTRRPARCARAIRSPRGRASATSP